MILLTILTTLFLLNYYYGPLSSKILIQIIIASSMIKSNLPILSNFLIILILIFIITCASYAVFCTNNTIYSILFLILTFLFSALLIFLMNCDFLAFIFLLIYVGAIAILFLFVVSLLEIERFSGFTSFKSNIDTPLFLIFFFVFFVEVAYSFYKFFDIYKPPYVLGTFKNNEFLSFNYFDWFIINEKLININMFGSTLYSNLFLFLLLSGFILLIAIIGSVALTTTSYKEYQNKSQHLFKQISRIT